jgi:hypothetical protein
MVVFTCPSATPGPSYRSRQERDSRFSRLESRAQVSIFSQASDFGCAKERSAVIAGSVA